MGKRVKRIPATENGRGIMYTARSGRVYRITKHVNKQVFYLWKSVEGMYEKVRESKSPYDLYEAIDQLEGL